MLCHHVAEQLEIRLRLPMTNARREEIILYVRGKLVTAFKQGVYAGRSATLQRKPGLFGPVLFLLLTPVRHVREALESEPSPATLRRQVAALEEALERVPASVRAELGELSRALAALEASLDKRAR